MRRTNPGPTKKARILAMYPEVLDVEAIARALETTPTYVANTLIAAGLPVAYSDVFTTSRQPLNPYARELAGVLHFQDVPTTRACLERLDGILADYEGQGDFRGIFQVQQLALLGKLRARAIGKLEESALFADWLSRHGCLPARAMPQRRPWPDLPTPGDCWFIEMAEPSEGATMSTAIPNRRHGHPYRMYETLVTQPAVLADLLGCGWDQAEAAAGLLRDRSRVLLVGIGSSLHAAMAGEHWLRRLAGIEAWAVPSLEFLFDGPTLLPGDAVLVISHSGGPGYTRDSLARAGAAGIPVVTLTGRDSAMPPATLALQASAQEVCKCHTAGYSSALLVLLQLATTLAEARGRTLPADWQAQLQQIPPIMTAQLAGDMGEYQAVAVDLVHARTVVAIGGGLHQATAAEVGLKIQEAVHKPVLSMTVEALAHGPLAALGQGDIVLSTLPPGAPALPRQAQLVNGLAELGIPVLGIGTGSRQLATLEGPEILAPLTHLVPWQLLTYWYAVAAKVDPDWNRLDEPAHAAAKRHY